MDVGERASGGRRLAKIPYELVGITRDDIVLRVAQEGVKNEVFRRDGVRGCVRR